MSNARPGDRSRGPLSLGRFLAAAAAIVAIAAGAELALGRKLWGISGQPGFWSGDVNSSHNSQYFADPYSFTHITHGILFYGLFFLAARKFSLRSRALMTLAVEAGWEIFENTSFVIDRYRATTISLNYFGDSVVNSMSDILFCLLGFSLAALLPARVAAAGVGLMEAILALTIHDSLLLNIIMLIHPIPAILHWQAGQ